MEKNIADYEKVTDEIKNYKVKSSLLNKSDDYAFSALCIDSVFYQNPSFILNNGEIQTMVVDGVNDSGIDIILRDPNNTEATDIIIGQSKFYQNITSEDIRDAIHKMIDTYNNLSAGKNGSTRQEVIQKFADVTSDMGDESKIHFVLFTSAPQNRINVPPLQKIVSDAFLGNSSFDFQIWFGKDILEAINDKKSRRDSVENGRLNIDDKSNVLLYGDDGDAAIVNISALSLKNLFNKEGKTLLAKNLRYYIRKKDIDEAIRDTIVNHPDDFWFRNNGITIICDDFEIDGPSVKLSNFSIVNGGQTTAMISKGSEVNEDNDFFLPCKIIRSRGTDELEKANFSLDIAKATNSQKPIKPADLKANAPEQVMFVQEMRNMGIYYQTKRGEKIEKAFSEDFKNTDLPETGRLCLAGIFQLPGTARNHPSKMYDDMFYNIIFNKNTESVIAPFVKDLLYINYYFDKGGFKGRFAKDYSIQADIIPFANNSRTLCIAFSAFASRFTNGNITDDAINQMRNAKEPFADYYHDYIYSGVRNIKQDKGGIFQKDLSKDQIDEGLYSLFTAIINAGYTHYCALRDSGTVSNESNYLKNDLRYYQILKASFPMLRSTIEEVKGIFNSI